jgi:hypothetical protein
MADWRNRIVGEGSQPASAFTANPRNWRIHTAAQQAALSGVLDEVGWVQRVIVNRRTGHLLDGHERVAQALQAGDADVPYVEVDLDEREERLMLAMLDPIGAMAVTDQEAYDALLESVTAGDESVSQMVDDMLGATEDPLERYRRRQDMARDTLSERFVVPPFSVLDARQGYWQRRKRAWIDLGIRSEVGRGENLLGFSHEVRSSYQPAFSTEGKRTEQTGTSIFDPVLCECAYTWWTGPGFRVLDPFAGGSVRGIVAAYLGRSYIGVELREEQVEANEEQAREIGGALGADTGLEKDYAWAVPTSTPQDEVQAALAAALRGQETQRDTGAASWIEPRWIVGDSSGVRDMVDHQVDFIFSCPPYYDLEVYSDLPGELSAAPTYEEFLQAYRHIVAESVALLRQDRFACFVVGDLRDQNGVYRNFVSDTIQAFRDAGCELYNEGILVTAVNSLPLRTSNLFAGGRKLGKTHQNVLVFVKGDWRRAVEACGPIEVALPPGLAEALETEGN